MIRTDVLLGDLIGLLDDQGDDDSVLSAEALGVGQRGNLITDRISVGNLRDNVSLTSG